jgi:hypothetical protein
MRNEKLPPRSKLVRLAAYGGVWKHAATFSADTMIEPLPEFCDLTDQVLRA